MGSFGRNGRDNWSHFTVDTLGGGRDGRDNWSHIQGLYLGASRDGRDTDWVSFLYSNLGTISLPYSLCQVEATFKLDMCTNTQYIWCETKLAPNALVCLFVQQLHQLHVNW